MLIFARPAQILCAQNALENAGMKSCTRAAACLYPISFARVHKNGNKLMQALAAWLFSLAR